MPHDSESCGGAPLSLWTFRSGKISRDGSVTQNRPGFPWFDGRGTDGSSRGICAHLASQAARQPRQRVRRGFAPAVAAQAGRGKAGHEAWTNSDRPRPDGHRLDQAPLRRTLSCLVGFSGQRGGLVSSDDGIRELIGPTLESLMAVIHRANSPHLCRSAAGCKTLDAQPYPVGIVSLSSAYRQSA